MKEAPKPEVKCVPDHILTPADLPHNKELIAGIKPAPPAPFIDRRDGGFLKQQFANAHQFLGELRIDHGNALGLLRQAQRTLSDLQKLRKKYAKKADTSLAFTSQIKLLDGKIENAEHDVAIAERTEKNLARRVAGQEQGIKDFPKLRPRPESPTNKEVMDDYEEIQELQMALR